jgi:hypothetical protein
MSEQVLISLISAVSGIGVAYIVNVAAKKVQERKAEKQPKDRMEQMFDGYERLIKQKDVEDDRKARTMKSLEEELTFTRKTVARLEKALEDTQKELEISRDENKELKVLLHRMRVEYQHVKNDNPESTEEV